MAEGVAFVDECTVHVRGGPGGDGTTAFRREKHVPRGGPDGGDGGNGGSVIFVASHNTTSLIDLHRMPHRRAEGGARGEGDHKNGRAGVDMIVPVPIGTVIMDRDSREVLEDLSHEGQQCVVAPGGRGGRGNASFATKYRRIPKFHEFGEVVEDRSLRLELKLIADVGLVGFPSAGKSSLIRALSSATPRVEAWPFTTLTPHLGVMRAGEGDVVTDVVLADVPGLVEGAAEGKGLGHRFLRHIERCHVLLHVLDAAPFDTEREPARDLALLRDELRRYDDTMLNRPQLVVLNKIDLPDGQAAAELFADDLAGEEVLEISALTGEGLEKLRWRIAELVNATRIAKVEEVRVLDDAPVVLRPLRTRDDMTITKTDSGAYRVTSERVERWVAMLPSGNPEAMRFLQGRMRRAKVEKKLIKAGARIGDEVVIGKLVLDFHPDPNELPVAEREAALAAELEADLAARGDGGADDDWDDWVDDAGLKADADVDGSSDAGGWGEVDEEPVG